MKMLASLAIGAATALSAVAVIAFPSRAQQAAPRRDNGMAQELPRGSTAL